MKIVLLVCDTPPESLEQKHGNYHKLFQDLFKSDEIIPFDCTRNEFPSLEEFEYFVITGSKYSVLDQFDWIKNLFEFIRKVDGTDKRLVGVCFGHQAVAVALGGKVTKNPLGWEVGLTLIKLNKNELLDEGIFPSTQELEIYQMHQDHVIEPPHGFKVIGYSDKSPIHLMIKPKNILTVQGHPEYLEGFVTDLVKLRHELGIFDVEFVNSIKLQGQNDPTLIQSIRSFLSQ